MKKNLLFAFLFFLSVSSQAETIIFNDGTAIYEKMISQNKDSVTIELKDGKKEQFDKKNILRVTYKSLTQEQIKEILKESNITPPAPKEAVNNENKPTLKGALWRSALLPGWGQFYQNRKFTSGILFSSFLAGFIALGYNYREYNSEVRNYHDKETTYMTSLFLSSNAELKYLQRKELVDQGIVLNKASNRLRITEELLVGFYLVNLLDIIIFRPKDNLAVRASLHRDQLGFSVIFQF